MIAVKIIATVGVLLVWLAITAVWGFFATLGGKEDDFILWLACSVVGSGAAGVLVVYIWYQ